jgi:serine/threonine protein kinase
MNLSANNLLKGRYRIESVLGQGGMGAVYKAVDELLGVFVAVKENLFLSKEFSLQFKEEARILASLKHPNLPRVLDFCSIDGQGQYLVMDFVEGEDLRDLLKQSGPLTEKDVVLIGYHISDALHYMHSQEPPVVHRDVKPGNIKITANNEIFLVDFGLAKQTESRTQMTMTGARAMTPGFSPPEQYGTARTDERSDIYSLGATLYNALTGVVPEDALDRVTDKYDLTPILDHRRDTERRLVRVIEKAMALNPEDRYQSAREFQEALLHSARMESVTSDIRLLRKFDLNHVQDLPKEPIAPKQSSSKSSKSKARLTSKNKAWVGWLFFAMIAFAIVGMVTMQTDWVNALFINQNIGTATTVALLKTPTIEVSHTFVPSDTIIAPTLTKTGVPSTLTPTATKILTATESEGSLPPMTNGTETPTPTITESPLPSPTTRPIALQDRFPIVFASNQNGSNQLWLMDESGEDRFRLTNMTNGACQPKWSPDGSQIVFVSPCQYATDKYAGGVLYLYSLDDKSIIPLLEVMDADQKTGNFDPEWSPDGSKVAYTSLRNNISEINVYDIPSKVVTLINTGGMEALHASWHPDGDALIFAVDDYYSSLWQVSLDGEELLQVTYSGNVANYHPVWDQTGQFILFSQRDSGQVPRLVKLLKANFGSDIEDQIRISGGSSSFPVLSPVFTTGNDVIVFESWPDGKNHDIYRMNVDGTNLERLTTSSNYEFDPDYFHNRLDPEGELES